MKYTSGTGYTFSERVPVGHFCQTCTLLFPLYHSLIFTPPHSHSNRLHNTTYAMAYVPPHRRNAAKPTQIPSTVTPSPSRSSATRSFKSAPARSHSQTPWSTSVPTNGSPNEPISQTLASPSPIPSASAPAGRDTSVSPTLHVYGDSFVGPLKLLSDECVRINPFKGASAKVSIFPSGQRGAKKRKKRWLTRLVSDFRA